MPISGEMYVWGDRAKNVPEESGVYALYNEAKVLIYIGASVNLQERFTHYLETNFSKDPANVKSNITRESLLQSKKTE